MAPNADQSRIRHRFNNGDELFDTNGDEALIQSDHSPSPIALKDLKGTEVAIDGVVYDMKGFKHPGGDSVLIFGGNDVTVQYKMIHPYHSSKHLEKMKRVGKLNPLDCQHDYLFDTEFEREIKREVFKIVPRGKEFGTYGYLGRVAFYVSLLAYLQYRWATDGASWKLAAILGVSKALIGLNVQHDSNHGAASRKPWVNDVLGFGADFIGGNKWLWMLQHWTHHAFTNHQEKDPDSFSAEPMLLFNDYPLRHSARQFYHKYQIFFLLPILSFYWLSSIFNTQILDLKQSGADFVGIKMDNDFIVKRRKYAVTIRVLYIYWNFVCPLKIAGLNFTTLIQILFMGACLSLTLSCLFMLSHNFEDSERDPTKDHRTTGKSVCWFKSQVETSSTYGSFISGYLTGGLNFQVEHHLFPRMCSAYYPYIAPTVREICKKHNVKYAYYPWVWQNFLSTCKYMHQAGTGSNWMRPLEGDL